jgi:cell division transport system permease protein
VLILAAAVGVAGLWLSSALSDTQPGHDPALLDRGDVIVSLCDDRECPTITEAERADLEAELAADPAVARFLFESKQDAYERFAELFADQPDLVDSVAPDVLPASFQVWLEPDARPEEVVARYDAFPGVEEAFVPTVP